VASSRHLSDLWALVRAVLAESVELVDSTAVSGCSDPTWADPVSVPAVEVGVATLIVVVAAAAVVETAAGAAFVSAAEFAFVVGIVL